MHTNTTGISSLQNWLNHFFSSTGFYFKSIKLWKVVMKCENLFFNFLVLFLKVFIFEVVTFLVWCLFFQINFSVAVRMYNTHDFDELFFFLAAVSNDNWKLDFSSFCSNHCKRNKFFHQNHAAYQLKLFLKKWSLKKKSRSKKLLQSCIFLLPHC